MKLEFTSFSDFLDESLASPLTNMSTEHMKKVLSSHWGEHAANIKSVHFHKLHAGTDAHYHVISHDDEEGTYMVHSVHLSHHAQNGIQADHVGAMPDSEHHSYHEAVHDVNGLSESVVTQTPKHKEGDDVHVRLNAYTIAQGVVDRVGEFGYHVKFSEGKPPSHYSPDCVHGSYEEAAKKIKRFKLKLPDEKVGAKK